MLCCAVVCCVQEEEEREVEEVEDLLEYYLQRAATTQVGGRAACNSWAGQPQCVCAGSGPLQSTVQLLLGLVFPVRGMRVR